MEALPKSNDQREVHEDAKGYYTPSIGGHLDLAGNAADPDVEFKIGQFSALINNQAFPCVGAKSALSRKTYRIGVYDHLESSAATAALAQHLYRFIEEQEGGEGALPSPFSTFAAIFDMPHIQSEAHAHDLVWKQLQQLHTADASIYDYAPDVSDNVDNPDFAFSMAGKAFFVVGLNPCASRFSRRFTYPTIVFNTHSQFQELRRRKLFDRMQSTIRARDTNLQGGVNPNLSNFGDRSEAMQYSGMLVSASAQCPFHAIRKEAQP